MVIFADRLRRFCSVRIQTIKSCAETMHAVIRRREITAVSQHRSQPRARRCRGHKRNLSASRRKRQPCAHLKRRCRAGICQDDNVGANDATVRVTGRDATRRRPPRFDNLSAEDDLGAIRRGRLEDIARPYPAALRKMQRLWEARSPAMSGRNLCVDDLEHVLRQCAGFGNQNLTFRVAGGQSELQNTAGMKEVGTFRPVGQSKAPGGRMKTPIERLRRG